MNSYLWRWGLNRQMSTPAMVFASLLKLMITSVGVFWVVSFLVSRLFVFSEAYMTFIGILKDEQWLLKQCESAEFYTNLRAHTDLCNEVRRNAERSPVLFALNEGAQTSHICGRHSCTDAIAFLSSSAGWPALAAIVVTVLLAPTLLVRIVRSVVNGEHSQRDERILPVTEASEHPLLRHRNVHQYQKFQA